MGETIGGEGDGYPPKVAPNRLDPTAWVASERGSIPFDAVFFLPDYTESQVKYQVKV